MGKKLYVGNLAYETDDQALSSLFSTFGTVDSVKVIVDRDSGRSKGFGFVEMASDNEALTAMESLNGSMQLGRTIDVSEAKPMAPREGRGLNGESRRR